VAADYGPLIEDVNKMIQMNQVYIAAVNTVMVAQKKRIFQDGKAANGSQIGQYGTKPISIAKDKQAKNTGKTYFKGGYREYKSLVGKGASFVNLRNTDQTMMDLGTTVSGNEYGIGFNNEFNANKMEWNETRFNKDISITSDAEDELFLNVVNFELNRQ